MPLAAADHAWSTHHLYSPESHLFLDSWLCVSAREIWVEWNRKSWARGRAARAACDQQDQPAGGDAGRLLVRLQQGALAGHFEGGNHALCGAASRPARGGTDPRDDEHRRLRNAEGGPGRNPFGRGSPVVLGSSVPSRPRETRSAMPKKSLSGGTPNSKRNDQRLPGPSLESCPETSLRPKAAGNCCGCRLRA